MKLANFSVNRPVTIVMVVLAILIIGAVSLDDINLDLFPELNLPVAAVITNYDGSAPQEVENLITMPIENAAGTVSNLNSIHSTSSMGNSIVIFNFEWGTDMDLAALEIREKVDFVKAFLPDDADTPLVMKLDPAMMPIFQLGIGGDLPLQEVMYIAEDTIKPRLERIEGVASVDIVGGMTREIQVKVNPEQLQIYEIGLNQVIQSLQTQNRSLSAGQITDGHKETMIRVTGEYQGVEQIARTPIHTPNGNVIRLQDIAVVEDAFKDITSYSRVNGLPSIGISVQKQTNANTVQVIQEARLVIEELKKQLPANIEIAITLDQAEFIEQSIQNVIRNLIIGGLLAVLVLLVFLRNIKSTLVIALAMPISLVATFILMYFGGLTINMMTLGGLALGIGMMVDSAIVVLENIFRHREEGLELNDAAKDGANEVSSAITASTFTTVAVFFPILFVDGIASQLFSELALTVSFSLIASLLVALTLIPMLSSRLLKVNESNKNGTRNNKLFKGILSTTNQWFEKMESTYEKSLKWCISHKIITVTIVLITFVGSIALVPIIGTELMPEMDEGTIAVSVDMPDGAKLDETDEIVKGIEMAFDSFKNEVETITVSVGGSSFGPGGPSDSGKGQVEVTLVPQNKRQYSTQEIANAIGKIVDNIAGAEITVSTNEGTANMGVSDDPISLAIKGEDLDELYSLSEEIIAVISKVPGTKDVSHSFEEGQQELRFIVDSDKTAIYGLNVAQIASTARAGIEGQVATKYRTGNDEIDVRVKLADHAQNDRNSVENIMIDSYLGPVPLGEVVEIHNVTGMSSIVREDQVRTVTVTSQLNQRDLGSVTADVEKAINEQIILPVGYSIEFGGQGTDMVDAFGDLLKALLLAIVLVYMIMAGQFESLLHPFIIMFSLPVTVIGVVLALIITGQSLSIVTFIGIIMLAGIVVNNAIVLVDYINILRRKGKTKEEAIIVAGPTRLRPILMTALTTILAMVPLALGIGEGSEMQAPMAIAVIGGLTTSTFLTLLFVPVMYLILDDFSDYLTGKKKINVQNDMINKV